MVRGVCHNMVARQQLQLCPRVASLLMQEESGMAPDAAPLAGIMSYLSDLAAGCLLRGLPRIHHPSREAQGAVKTQLHLPSVSQVMRA